MSFNLEKFKAGVPAISRCGEEWYHAGDIFDTYYPISAGCVRGFSTFTEYGTFYVDGEHNNDLISMKDVVDDIMNAPPEESDYKKREHEFVEKFVIANRFDNNGIFRSVERLIGEAEALFAAIEEHYK